MDGSKNGRQIFPFKKFSRLRVKQFKLKFIDKFNYMYIRWHFFQYVFVDIYFVL